MIDVTIYAGESANIQIQVNDQDGDPKNLFAATGLFRIGRGNRVYLSKATTFVNDGPDGLVQVDIEIEEAKSLVARLYDYQFIITDSDGDVQVVKENQIRVKEILPMPIPVVATPSSLTFTSAAALTAA